ncbi:MAG: amidohydrolase family protein [Phycisphaerae bacterium]|nr:amidohydrolase family protein [Phycisphaerae bacterium]
MMLRPRYLRRIHPVVAVILLSIPWIGVTRADEYELDTAIFVRNVSAVVQPGKTIEGCNILIDAGRIVAIGPDIEPPAGAKVIDGSGHFAYAGFIDGFTRTATKPVEASPASERRYEGEAPSQTEGPIVRMPTASRVGIHPERAAHETLDWTATAFEAHRAAGFTAALVAPPRAMFGGDASLVALSDRPLRDSVLRPTVAQTAAFATPERRKLAARGSYPGTLLGVYAMLRQTLYDAQWYRDTQTFLLRNPRGGEPLPLDPALAALQAVISGARPLIWEADSPDEIDRVRALAGEFGFQPWLVGVRRAYKRIDAIKGQDIPLIVSLRLPKKPAEYKFEASKIRKAAEDRSLFGEAWEKRPFAPPALYDEYKRERDERLTNLRDLQVKGVKWCLSTADAPADALESLREFIGAGLSADDALAALTTTPAKLFGVDRDLGTLAAGKAAHIAIFTKKIEDKEARCHFTIAAGRLFEFDVKKPAPKGKKPKGDNAERDDDPPFDCGDGHSHEAMSAGMQTPPPSDHAPAEDDEEEPAPSATNEPAVAASAPASSPASQPAEEIPAGPLDVLLQHAPNWEIETEATRAPQLKTGGNVMLANATVLTGVGPARVECSVLIQNGKIAAIGEDITPPDNIAIVDCTDYVIAPAVIDPHAHIALDGVNEFSGSVTPEVRVSDLIDSEQRQIYDAVAGGCATIHAMHGSANTIGGECCILKLRYGKAADELRMAGAPRTVKFATGENVKSSRGENTIENDENESKTRFPRTRMGVETTMRRALAAGREYSELRRAYATEKANRQPKQAAKPPMRRDLRLEALADIVDGTLWINMHCYRADEVLRALAVAESFGVRMGGLHHILEGYRIMPEILRHGVGTATFSDWWAYKVEAYDAVPQNAGLLQRFGVNSTLKSDSAEMMRHMWLEAAKCMAVSNLTSDEALKLVTYNAAKFFSLEDRIGSIQVGLEADIVVFDGHPLDTFSRCVMTLIDGEAYYTHRDFNPGKPPAPTRPMYSFPQDRWAADPELTETWIGDGSGRMPPSYRADAFPEWLRSGAIADGYALVGARVHTVDGPEIDGGVVLVRGSQIEAVLAADANVPDGYQRMMLSGFHVYPGLINAATRVGLQEVEAVPVTIDTREIGRFQADVSALSAVNPHSRMIEISRAVGILSGFIVPEGLMVSGQAGLVDFAGWTMPEMAAIDASGLVVSVPSLPASAIVPPEEEDKEREKRMKRVRGQQRELREFFETARRYAERSASTSPASGKPLFDPRYEAMMPYVRGERPVLFEAGGYKQILEALMFAEQVGVRPIILGGREAWKVAGLLAERHVPVIYEGTMGFPDRYDPWDINYRGAALLEAAGVKFCFSHRDADLAKQLPSEAGFAVAHGLSAATALRAMTLTSAEILGVDAQLGSITAGKRANLVIANGDILQASTRVFATFVGGKPAMAESDHTRAAAKFADRPLPALAPAAELRGPKSQSR